MLSHNARICLVTPGQPSTNPRLVKEADILSEAGYDVTVVASKYQEWANEADAVFGEREWSVQWLHFGPMASRPRDFWQRIRRRGSREVVKLIGPQFGLTERALHYVIPELTQLVRSVPADLYIAHNLAALPAAYHAAHAHNAALGFDAEDFHRDELQKKPENELTRKITCAVEERYIPKCDYVTAASDGIGVAYAEVLGIKPPSTILNVFPWIERENHVPENQLEQEVPARKQSLYWFSQTIGPDRGLEDALRTLPLLPENVILSLRGKWSPGYENTFRKEARRLGVANRVRHLDLVPPNELIPRTARHDVGLALEQPSTSTNRAICLTNKLFTYLVAGVPFVATDTPGQRPIVENLPEVSRLYSPGSHEECAARISELLASTGLKERALLAARDRYCWEVEGKAFLEIIRGVLKSTEVAKS